MRLLAVTLSAVAILAGPAAVAQQPTAGDLAAIRRPLPPPPVDDNAPPSVYLAAAAQALAAHRDGEAQEAMERAESRALDRSVRPSLAKTPDRKPLVQQIAAARAALASGDRGLAAELVQSALHDPEAMK